MKTLKDLVEEIEMRKKNGNGDKWFERLVREKDLRQSAIEWIKEIRKFTKEDYIKGTMTGEELWDFFVKGEVYLEKPKGTLEWFELTKQTLINWIKHFFNLTEDDIDA